MHGYNNPKQVFLDTSQRRWQAVKRWGITAGLVLSMLGSLVYLSLLFMPPGAPFSLSSAYGHSVLSALKPETRAEIVRGLRARQSYSRLRRHIRATHGSWPAMHNPAGSRHAVVAAFYTNWDPGALADLREHVTCLTHVIPAWLALSPKSGEAPFVTRFNKALGDDQVLHLAASNRVAITPMIDNVVSGAFNWDVLRDLLMDRDRQTRLAVSLRDYMLAHGYSGVNVDFEPSYDAQSMSLADRRQAKWLMRHELPRFMRTLSGVFHRAHLTVTQDVPPAHPDLDYQALADACDYLIVMFYDQHTVSHQAGPIAGQDWTVDQYRQVFSKVNPRKVILGIGNYCGDWPVLSDGKGNVREDASGEILFNGPGVNLNVGAALYVASKAQADIHMENDDLNPYFTYRAADGVDHIVFMLDAVTAYNQIRAAAPYQPAGGALWCLGREDPVIWRFFSRDAWGRQAPASAFCRVKYPEQMDVSQSSNGEIIDIDATPQVGLRRVRMNKQGLITSESFLRYPQPYIIGRHGNTPDKKVAITFDDGPDPRYTPQILDILRRYRAPATFFVVGEQVQQYPWIVKQCWDAGCEIGNHTFTHPHFGRVSRLRGELELNATERLIESITGHSTRLFRPPYGESADTNPSMQEITVLREVHDMGYVSVGMNIDTKDYEAENTDQIVSAVKRQLHQGHVILMHDGGGDRSRTVAALPKVITELRRSGYQLVTVTDLLGPAYRSQMLPPVPPLQKTLATVDGWAFQQAVMVGSVFRWLFLVTIALGLLRMVVMTLLAVLQQRRDTRSPDCAETPPVTVLVPAYNEGNTIVRTVKSVLMSGYSPVRVIVIDDGSTDGTAEIAASAFAGDQRVHVITQPNAGKSAALNNGLSAADTDIVVCVDADTIVHPGAIGFLVEHFRDPRVAAVAGNIKVGNRNNPLTIWQSIEYITNQNLDRRAYAFFYTVPVVPGALGAWRKQAVEQAGGLSADTLAEDTDLTFRLNLLGFRTLADNRAIAWTEAPDTVAGLAKQRYRWVFGTLQSLWKHRRTFLNHRYGVFGWAVMPVMAVYAVGFQILAPVVDLAILLCLVNNSVLPVLAYWSAFFAIDLLGAVIAFRLDREDPRQLAWLFWQRFFYRQFMYYVVIRSAISALKGVPVGWAKLQRKATVGHSLD